MRSTFLLILLACTGCAQVQYLDQALTLKAYSDEKDAQNAYVAAHDARFEEILRQSRDPAAFKLYSHKEDFVRAFGEPVFCRAPRAQGDLEECLYRRIVKPLESPRVLLYFNAAGGLVRWEGGGS